MDEKKILVIDDEWAIRYLLEGQLRRAGFTVYAAPNGSEGLAVLPTFVPDLVILDIMMPEMDGFEVCRRIRCHSQAAATPIMFLSGSTTKEYKRLAFELGADDFLVKPFQTEELLARIEALFQRGPHQRGPDGQNGSQRDDGTPPAAPGRIVALLGARPDVGATPLAIQLSETIALHATWPVLLLDLDFFAGRIAEQLKLYPTPHLGHLLQTAAAGGDVWSLVEEHAQPHQAGLRVIPAPLFGRDNEWPCATRLAQLLRTLADTGYYIVLDLGSALHEWAQAALRAADLIYVVTSGQPSDSRPFSDIAGQLCQSGIQAEQIIPVAVESRSRPGHEAATPAYLSGARSRRRFWSEDNRLRQLVNVMA